MDTEPLEQRIAAVLADEPVAFAYLFGSVARGGQRPDSDIDVAVHFEPALPAKERFERGLRLGGRLEIELGQPVDLVDLEEAPLRLAGRILQERVVICGADRPERVHYETALFKRYTDFMHHARELDAELLSAMARERP